MKATILVPRWESRGLVALSVLMGLVVGAIPVKWLIHATFHWTATGTGAQWIPGAVIPLILTTGFLVLAALPMLLLGAALALRCRHWFTVAVCGGAFSVGQSLASIVSWYGDETTITSTSLLTQLLWMTVYVPAGCLLLGAFPTMLGYGVVRLVVRVTEGDGTRCWRCLYTLGSASITKCPECGTPVEASHCRFRLVHTTADWAQRNRRWLNVVVVAVTLVTPITVVLLTFKAHPQAAAFVRRFEPVGKISGGFMRLNVYTKPTPGLGAIIRPSKPDNVVIWVVYLERDVPGLPAMQFQVHFQSDIDSNTWYEASPRVLCDLDRLQADWVIANAVPAGLVEAMAQRASYVPSTVGTADVRIDPTDFLPAEAGGRAP